MIMVRNEDGTYSQVGFVKDNDGIDTEYIYDKDGDIVFEKGFTRETSGTVPLTINGIGKDLKDWSITGNTVQNGTPTPENPVEVQAVGDRTGNLFDKNDCTVAGYIKNDGTISITADNWFTTKNYIKCSGIITMNALNGLGTAAHIACYDEQKNLLGACRITENNQKQNTINLIDGTKYIKACSRDNNLDSLMLNEGSTPLPYEPYGYKIPVVTRGKNLFNCNDEPTLSNVTKIYTISNLDINKYYTCSTSFEKIPEVALASIYFAGGSSRSNGVWKDTPRTFKPDTNGVINMFIRHIAEKGAPAIFDKVISGEITIMVEEDSTATPYEPYHEPITTPIYLPTPLYSGEVMRNDGSREVKFDKLVLTGEEAITVHKSFEDRTILIRIPSLKAKSNGIIYCTHLQNVHFAKLYNNEEQGVSSHSSNDLNNLYCLISGFTNLTQYKDFFRNEYAAGTPITLWYQLAEPKTETFIAPQIPTLNGTTVIDVDTKVEPSNIYIKYKSSK